MMYRTIDCNFHDDPKVRRLSSYTVAWIFSVLFTNKHSHMSGLYFITPDTITHISMVPQELVTEALSELCQKKLIFIDQDRDLIFVKSMFKRQYLDMCWKKGPSKSVLDGVAKHLATLNGSPLIHQFLTTYKAISIPYVDPTPEGGGDRPPDGVGDGRGPVSVSVSGTEVPPPTPSRGKSRQPRTSPEESKRIAEEAMDRLPLPKYTEKYAYLDVPREFLAFKNHHLARPGNYHGAKRITDWNRAFHNWCNADWKKPIETTTDDRPRPRGGWAEE